MGQYKLYMHDTYFDINNMMSNVYSPFLYALRYKDEAQVNHFYVLASSQLQLQPQINISHENQSRLRKSRGKTPISHHKASHKAFKDSPKWLSVQLRESQQIAKWSEYQPSNWKVVGLIPSVATLVLLHVSKKVHMPVTLFQSTKLLNGQLVLTREAAHPASDINGYLGSRRQTAVRVC